MRAISAAIPLLFLLGCAAAQLRDVDEAQGNCTLEDGRSGAYVPPKVSEPGAHPRLPRAPATDEPALTGAYDCLVRTNGVVAHCRVLKSVPGADEFAAGALSSWRFAPATCAGEAVPARIVITLQPTYIPLCRAHDRSEVDLQNELPRSEAIVAARRLEEEFGRGQHPFAFRMPEDRCVTSDGREGGLATLKLLSGSAITYPDVAIENRQHGLILARCVVRASGKVEACELVCSDVPAAEGVVLRGLSSWRMSPPRCGEEPVDLSYTIPVRFRRPR